MVRNGVAAVYVRGEWRTEHSGSASAATSTVHGEPQAQVMKLGESLLFIRSPPASATSARSRQHRRHRDADPQSQQFLEDPALGTDYGARMLLGESLSLGIDIRLQAV